MSTSVSNMTIVHLIWSLTLGGAESLVVDLANVQSAQHLVYIVVINSNLSSSVIESLSINVQVILLNRPIASRNPSFVWELNRFLLAVSPDVVHCHNPSLISIVFCRRKRTVLTVHNTSVILQSSVRRYKKVFAISSAVKEHILKQHLCDVSVIYNGVVPTKIKPKQSDSGKSTFKIVQIGRLIHEQKGQHILIRALHVLVNKYEICNVHLTLIGQGPSYEFLMELVQNLGIQDFTTFAGEQTRNVVYNSLSEYDLLVQPSITEGFGLTIVEAMIARVPVLTSDLDGPMEVTGYGKFASVFSAGDPSDCAAKMHEVINNLGSIEHNQRISDSCEHAMTNFSIDATAAAYFSEYGLLS
jgi:glycosyltransferase involved in cell wall biosynthesis